MAPTIHCIRHGQGFHNLYGDYTLPDPRLTPLGEEQCATLQSQHFPPGQQEGIKLIVASPMTRALHTAWLVFQPLLSSKDIQILAFPDAQETSSDPCDVGTDLPDLSSFLGSQNPPWPVDLSLLTPGWNEKRFRGRYSPHSDSIKARARATRLFLREKVAELVDQEETDDVQIVLVSHGGLLHYLSDDWEGAADRPGTGWTNCEVRRYQFAENGDPDARLTETLSSRQARGLEHPMPGPEQQAKLFVKAMEGWEAQGLERPDRLEDPDSANVTAPPRQSETAKSETEKIGGPEKRQEGETEGNMHEKRETARQLRVTA